MAADDDVSMLCKGAKAWNEWRAKNGVRSPDLEEADLSVAAVGTLDLEGINLAEANLRRASLSGQNLTGADVRSADMAGANLRTINLTTADVRGANLQDAQMQPALAPFEEDLSADPTGAMNNLVREVLEEGGRWFIAQQEGSVSSVSLPSVFIVQGERMGAPSDLTMAKLDGADLRRANLRRCTFRDASLRDANLEGAVLEEARLVGADVTGANLRSVDLTELDLDNAVLREIPIEITLISSLRVLKLSNNRIVKIPVEIEALENLEVLDLRNNSLATLPEQLKKLPKLRQLYLQGNTRLGLLPEVLGEAPRLWDIFGGAKNAPAILDFYFRTTASRRPLNEAKLILVGFGGVGKTSLVNRFVAGAFNVQEKKTEGISIHEWSITLRSEERVRLNVWDFGGQEIMHATHQFFLTERSVYLLVLNGRQGREEADAEYWLRLIESFGKESPILVVLNKIKEHPFDLNRRALQQKFPSIRGFLETDCEDGSGISELARAVERQTDQLEHLRDAFPTNWFAIKDELSLSRNSYLTMAEYRGICEKYGEGDREAQAMLASHLHALGVALNFQNDPRLKDVHVLNPHWVTTAIYAILNAPVLASQNGEITLDQIGEILDRSVYPETTHMFLCHLMKKFELCFELGEDDSRYLIPDLLHVQEPGEASRFAVSECLNFEYEYPILPEGLLPRFIVRTHVLSTKRLRWRTGVILDFEGNSALIKADIQAKTVAIRVTGPSEGRRNLLSIVRSDFERIHRSFTFEVREMVPIANHPPLRIGYRELLVLEQKGFAQYPLVSGEDIVELNVKELLSGVEISGARRTNRASTTRSPGRLRLFYSYSHKDERWRDELETHLKLLEREGLIEPWHDRQIAGGQEWEGEISAALENADIILLLISADFIASDYAYGKEMKRAIERHESGDARVVPVIVRKVEWASAPFGKLQALPKNGKPVSTWSRRDDAWSNVSAGIRNVVRELTPRGAGRVN